MSPRSKMEYLEAIYIRYKKACVKEKTVILDEFCLNCGYHRKHAIRVLSELPASLLAGNSLVSQQAMVKSPKDKKGLNIIMPL